MPRRKKIAYWTERQIGQLRRLAGRRDVKSISRQLKRSVAAIRFKAHTEKISLARR